MNKYQYILCTIALLMTTLSVNALPAYKGEIEKQTTYGTTIKVTLQGDRWLHYFQSADGRCWSENEEGVLVPIAAPTDKQRETIHKAKRKVSPATNTAYPRNIAPRGLVILANYKNLKFNSENTQAAMSEMLNGSNYTHNGATGSARQYFIDQSMGQYQPQFDVVGPVELSKNYEYYGEDDKSVGYPGEDIHAVDMIVEACQLADKNFNVDFTKYDCNNDGEVDFVFVIYAGYGQAAGAPSNTIWPHSFWVSDFHGETAGGITCKIDGKKINTYACGPELNSYTGTNREGIGTFCHEFSHVLGLPDLYITGGTSNHRTLNTWSVLDYGCYNNESRTPAGYSAYERFFMGWLKPTLLNQAGTYTLNELQTTNTAGIITATGKANLIGNDPNPTEFYLIENRQKKGWDAYLAGHGMMITKIKYSYQKWYDNTVNNSKSTMGVDIIEATPNTSTSKKGDKATDLYPTGATFFTPYDDYPLTNITETEYGVISFDFMGGGQEIIISNIEDIDNEEHIVAIYDILGHYIQGNSLENLPKGIYIIKTNKSVRKISK